MERSYAENNAKTYAHDFFSFRSWVYKTGGYSPYKHPFYRAYIAFILLFLLYMESAAIYGVFLVSDWESILRALHTLLIGIFATFVILNRLAIHDTLQEMHSIIMSGMFSYENEELDAEEKRLMEGIVHEIRLKSTAWLSVLFVGGVSNMVCFPLTQALLVGEKEYDQIPYVINPYLSNFFWSPYNRTLPGFILMYFLNFLIIYYTYIVATCQNQIYLSCNVQTRVHLEVLNHSIMNIERRAYLMFMKKCGERLKNRQIENLYKNDFFQECLYLCLRSNVQHHQAILRFVQASRPFVGGTLFVLVSMASLFYANLFCLILQKPPLNYTINYIATLTVENCYTFYQCFFGQDIIDKSGSLFTTLYKTPWYNGNQKFKQLLLIMMTNTRIPIKQKAYFFDMEASFESYAERISVMYSIVNVLS